MKNIKTIILLLGLFAVSCQSWLDVEPGTEVKSDRLFEREQGFKDAIIGCYLLMTDIQLYGKELTAGFTEVLAHQFTLKQSNSYAEAEKFNYSLTTSSVDSMWNNLYTVIVNTNNILENIEGKEDFLHTTHYHIIKGEAVGLRGFLHFELLRLFGWGDLVATPSNLDRVSIPYQFNYNKVFPEQYTEREVLQFIIDDLEEAAALLENYDPWSNAYKSAGYELPNDDGFYTNRMTRFNYWAVRATLARVYMWMGDWESALQIVVDFIENQPAVDGLTWISDVTINDPEEKNRDLTFSTEHIFRLDVNSLYENLQINYDPNYNSPDINNQLFYHTSTQMNELYERSNAQEQIGASDYRYTRLYTSSGDENVLRKFINFDGYLYPNRMPLIRMSEVYYMAAECYNKTGRIDEAIETLDVVRKARGIADRFMLETTLTDDRRTAETVTTEIEKEYKKEFLGEGQMFFYYKRIGSPRMGTASVNDKDAVYVLPIPDSEIDAGGRVPNYSTED